MPLNQEPNNIFPFEGFIAYLQHNNYNVGVDTYLRVQELMNHIEPNTPIQRLRHILCPIFAQNPDEQEKFYYLFDAYFAKFDILDETEFSEIHENKTPIVDTENPTPTKTKWKLPKRWQARLFTIVLTIILGLLANIGWKFYTNYEESFSYFHGKYQIEHPQRRDRLQYAWEEIRSKGHICDSLSANFDYTYKIEDKKYIVTIFQIPQNTKDNHKWTINGQSFTGKDATITKTFATTGNYPVQLEVRNQDSCKQSFSKTINITDDTTEKALSVFFTYQIDGLKVSFKDSSIAFSSKIKTREWNFGDNEPTNNSIKPIHEYKKYGRYEVCLTVTTQDGKQNQSCLLVNLQPVTFKVSNIPKFPMLPYLWSGEGEPKRPFFERLYDWITKFSIVFAIAAITLPLFFLLFRNLRRKSFVETDKNIEPPYFWPIKIEVKTNFYDANLWNKATTQLRKREEGEKDTLDVPESLQATLEAGGYPTLRYKASRRPIEYLFFIDRASYKDHQAIFFQQLAEKLGKEDIYIDVYFHNHHFQYFWKTFDERPLYLEEIIARHPKHRLVIMGDGQGLVDPYTGEIAESMQNILATWQYRALMTSVSTAEWGMKEVAIAKEFLVSPSTLKAFSNLAERFDKNTSTPLREWLNPTDDNAPDLRDESDIHHIIEQLKACLGTDLFLWFSACACYPELHWDMTMFLGKFLSDKYFSHKNTQNESYLLTEANVLKLSRLPYFRVGEISEKLRYALVTELDDVIEGEVRTAIIEVLNQNLPPEGTRVADKYYINLVLQKWQKDKQNATSEVKEEVERLLERDEVQDYVVLEKLKKEQLMGINFSEAWRSMLFRQGYPILGVKSWVVILASVICFIIALMTFFNFNRFTDFSYFNPEDNQSYYLQTRKDSINFYSRQGILDGGSRNSATWSSAMNNFTKTLTINRLDPKTYYNRAVSAFTIYRSNPLEMQQFLDYAIEDLEKAHSLIPVLDKAKIGDSTVYEYKTQMTKETINSSEEGSFLYSIQSGSIHRTNLSSKKSDISSDATINNFVVSSNDKILAAISNNKIDIYQTSNLKTPSKTFPEYETPKKVRLSETGKIIMTTQGAENAIKLWEIDATNSKPIQFDFGKKKVVDFQLSHDNKKIVVVTNDSSASVCNVSNGSLISTIPLRMAAPIIAAGFCWNDHLIYTADKLGNIYLCENSPNLPIFQNIVTKLNDLTHVSFNTDGSMMALANTSKMVKILGITGAEIASINSFTQKPSDITISSLGLSKDDTTLLISTNKNAFTFPITSSFEYKKHFVDLQILQKTGVEDLFDKDYKGELIIQEHTPKPEPFNTQDLFIDEILLKHGAIKYNLGIAYMEANEFQKAYQILSEIPVKPTDTIFLRILLTQAVSQMLWAESSGDLIQYQLALEKCDKINNIKKHYYASLQKEIDMLDLAKTIYRINEKFSQSHAKSDKLTNILNMACKVQNEVYKNYCNLRKDYEEIGQRDSTGYAPFKSKENKLWGYLAPDNSVYIEAIYEKASPFKGGFAFVTKRTTNNTLIEQMIANNKSVVYDKVGTMSENRMAVSKDGKWGYISSSYNGHNEKIKLRYQEANTFINGLAIVKLNNKYGFIDSTGKEIIKIEYDNVTPFDARGLAYVKKKDVPYYITREGKPWKGTSIAGKDSKPSDIQVKGLDEMVRKSVNSLTDRVLFKDNNNNHLGFKDNQGRIVVKAIYEDLWGYTENLAAARKDNKWGFIDRNGVMVIPNQYDHVNLAFQNGNAQVKQNNQTFWIDYKGNRIDDGNTKGGSAAIQSMEQTSIAPQTNSNTNLNSNSNSDFVKKGDWEFMPANNKWYAKHINSSIQIPQTFDKIPSIEDGGATDLYLVKTDNSSFFVNSKGNILGNQSYTDAKRFNIDGYASVKTGSKWGIIGLDGNFIVTPKSDEQIIKKDDVFIIKKGNSIINEQIKNKVEKKKEVIQQKVQDNVNQAVNQSYNYNQQAGDEMKAKSIEDKNRPVLNKIKSKVANKTAKK